MIRLTLLTAAAAVLAGCTASGREIDDGGRAYRELQDAPVAGPAARDEFLAEPWRLAEGPIPSRSDRSVGGRAQQLCDPNEFAFLIGRSAEEVRAENPPEPRRIISHDDLYTQDYVPGRLNFFLDAQGRVERITCG